MSPARPAECEVPEASALDRQVVAESCFRDAYRAPLAKPENWNVRIVKSFS